MTELRAKQRWVKRAGFLAVTLLLIIEIPAVFANTGTFIDTSNSSNGLRYSTQRHIFYDGTRWWAEYYNGSQSEMAYSSNKITWTAGKAIWNSSLTDSTEVKLYGSTTIYACITYKSGTIDYALFRKGNISGTTITWSPIRTAFSHNSDFTQRYYSCSVTYDGTTFTEVVSNPYGNAYEIAARSVDGGVTWGSVYTNTFATAGATVLSMSGGKQMFIRRIYDNVFPLDNRIITIIYNSGWGGIVYAESDNVANINDQFDGGFSAIEDGVNPDILHMVYLKRDTNPPSTITYSLRYVKYQSGWQAPVTIVTNVSATSYPTIAYDPVTSGLVVGYMNNSLAYVNTYNGVSWSNKTLIGNPSTPVNGYLAGMTQRAANEVNYLIENGGGAPYNITLLTLSYTTTTSTTTTTTTTTTVTAEPRNRTITFSYSVTCGVAGAGNPVLSYVLNGSARTYALTTVPTPITIDRGTVWTVTKPWFTNLHNFYPNVESGLALVDSTVNIQYSSCVPTCTSSDPFILLLAGCFFGMWYFTFYGVLGNFGVGLIFSAIAVALYLNNENPMSALLVFLIMGGVFTFILPALFLPLGAIFLAIGIAGSLYQVIRG